MPYPTIQELKETDKNQATPFDSIFVLQKKTERTAKNGSPFLSISLSDKTGGFSIVCFDNSPSYTLFGSLKEGEVVRVAGKIAYYQNQFSPHVDKAESLATETLTDEMIEQLVEVSPENPQKLWEELQSDIQALEPPELQQTVKLALEELGEGFKNAPGAILMHHAYRSGLLEHTVHILRGAKVLLPLYPEVDRNLALAGIILHDIGKAIEYEGELAYKKSKQGRLYGHVVLGYRLTRQAGLQARLDPSYLERLEHIILSHQGELEWGAAVLPGTPEAVFVSMIDNLDAKMGMVQNALRKTTPDTTFSDYLPGLKNAILMEPVG
jgi:3'-5' exoribonuclease